MVICLIRNHLGFRSQTIFCLRQFHLRRLAFLWLRREELDTLPFWNQVIRSHLLPRSRRVFCLQFLLLRSWHLSWLCRADLLFGVELGSLFGSVECSRNHWMNHGSRGSMAFSVVTSEVLWYRNFLEMARVQYSVKDQFVRFRNH